MIHQPLKLIAKQSQDMRCTHRRACTCNQRELDLQIYSISYPLETWNSTLNGWMEREREYLITPKHPKTMDQQPRDLPAFAP